MDDSIPRPVREAGGTILDALLALAAEREDVRRALTTVNAWLARELTRRAEVARTSAAPAPSPAELPAVHHDDVLVPRGPAPAPDDTRPVDLARIAARALWKADALALALARRAAGPAPGPDLRQRESELRSRQSAAGAPWAWMLDAPPARVEDDALEVLRRNYSNVARIAERLEQLERAEALEPAPPVDLLRLVAEAQSALLAALAGVGLRQDDDQRDLFQWLRDRTTRHRIYVDRHMRLEDPANPHSADELARRFEELAERALSQGAGRKHRTQLLNKVRYHVRRLIEGVAAPADEWNSLAAALERWREHHLELNDRGLVEVLGPLAALEVPAGISDAAAPVILEALRLVRGQDPARPDALAEVAVLLGGRRALMVSDTSDPAARAALAQELGLADLGWLTVPPVTADGARSDERIAAILAGLTASTAELVFMGVKLPQEEYLAFKDACVARHLPFVRLPGTLAPGAVAHQTARQVGWRLREPRPAP